MKHALHVCLCCKLRVNCLRNHSRMGREDMVVNHLPGRCRREGWRGRIRSAAARRLHL
jgi:hypothetical protein